MIRALYVGFGPLLATFLGLCDGYRILVVFPNPSRSHGNLGDGLVRHLLRAGHEVTYITPFVRTTAPHNLTYIDVSSTSKVYLEIADNPVVSLKEHLKGNIHLDQDGIFHLMSKISVLALEDQNMKDFLRDSTQEFDLVIAEWMFNELYSGFAALFGCPYIWMFPFEPNFVALSLIDEPTNPAYVANFELNIVPPLSFVERVKNLWFQITYQIRYYFFYNAIEKNIFARVFGPILIKKHGYIVPYDELRYNASLMFSYSHSSMSPALSIPQNLISVVGYHIDEDLQPLPEGVNNFMDNAKSGVIYFSMGSNLKSKSFPKHILQSLIKVFSEIEYTVLWKFEDHLEGYSNNVHVLNWAPQQSILAHPNCVLFITHGGLLSTTEVVHFGVPIIGIPVFYDQFSNVDKAVERGFAKKVTLSHNLAEDLKVAIVDILKDDRYAAKAKELSQIYHDRPVPPGVALVHWSRHVVATRGAPHLRSPALATPQYQKLYIDLLATILLIAYLTYAVMKLVTRKFWYRDCAARKKVA